MQKNCAVPYPIAFLMLCPSTDATELTLLQRREKVNALVDEEDEGPDLLAVEGSSRPNSDLLVQGDRNLMGGTPDRAGIAKERTKQSGEPSCQSCQRKSRDCWADWRSAGPGPDTEKGARASSATIGGGVLDAACRSSTRYSINYVARRSERLNPSFQYTDATSSSLIAYTR